MDPIFEEIINPEELASFRKKFIKEKTENQLTAETQFSFAWCLVRSSNKSDVQLGIQLLEQLYKQSKEENEKRDYLYYVAFGYTRIKEYQKALKFTKAMLEVQPQNHQVQILQDYIIKKEKKDGLIGIAVIGGVAAVGGIALAGLVGLGMALSKK
ncbi:hypothetical protein HELRODRAFT_184906 [Helobdella robusta]|uniref:Mitochondrial fission 1 protein n=1 Tax=Helobdella robusta TaxID=6412 RepID=T1FM57_HELRO|nr:hypothetical protein HELRODRAFT_184906 [Helobdella robusta]ESO05946.1 hypothetical protein HELRODRAFT_184906 [Helobdella robusta]